MDDITESEPIAPFGRWLAKAGETESDPNAMTLATATRDGVPSARIVLLKDVDDRGFVFYTNTESRKGGELDANPRAALCFHWKTLQRQVRVEGTISRVSGGEADRYFASRARDSRLGAWASEQSRPLASRQALRERFEAFSTRYPEGDVPRPEHWSGFRVTPARIEFWQDRPYRLHDRLVFTRNAEGWERELLYP